MVVVILILASLAVAGFVMLTDTRKNDNFKRLVAEGDVAAVNPPVASDDTADADGACSGSSSDGGSGGD